MKEKGEIRCPKKDCGLIVPYLQIKQVIDAKVLSNLEN